MAGGRPKIKFDLEQLEEMGRLQCTQAEVAAMFRCSVDTIRDRLEKDEEFSCTFKRGMEEGKVSLRRAQFKSALGGNVTMQIWLGKQLLGQTDKQVVENEITVRGPLVITKHNGKEPEDG